MAIPTPVSALRRRSTGLWIEAGFVAARRRLQTEWFGSPPHLLSLAGPSAEGFAAFPHDVRPAREATGQALLGGTFVLAGEALTIGAGGDPWNRPSPTRAFAVELHRFGWLRHLIALGEDGVREALRLVLEWRAMFGGWNSFSWSGEVLERRTFNLACAAGALSEIASETEIQLLASLLARHGRQLLKTTDPAGRAAERAVVTGVAGSALAGRAGERLITASMHRLERLLPITVLPDGGHVSRSPETTLELLFDLIALDDGWAQREFQTPEEASRAIDRMSAAIRFFRLPDGRLACFQGGEETEPERVDAVLARDDAEARAPIHAPHSGYQRLSGRAIEVMVDAGKPAPGRWSVTACATPGALEVVCNGERLITNVGWSDRAPPSGQALRLTGGGSTAALGNGSAGEPIGGWRAKVLSGRLVGGAREVEVKRTTAESGVWLDVSHDGWLDSLGLLHERRLFLDAAADELRGEDQFTPATSATPRVIPYSIRFHLFPEVEGIIARDNKSVLIRGPSQAGWWLRNDATEVRVEPSVHFRHGRQVATRQVVLMGHIRVDKGGRVRWKLTPVEGQTSA